MENTFSTSNHTQGNSVNDTVKNMTFTALMTAVICILGPLSLPIGPVPVSLTNLAIYITMYVLNWKSGSIAYALYMLIGLIGIPVFSGFTGGPAKLIGPTGGYLIGFLPMAMVIGICLQKVWNKPVLSAIVLEAATWIPYLLGTAWLSFSARMDFSAAFAVGVTPFIVIDFIKVCAAVCVGRILRKRLGVLG